MLQATTREDASRLRDFFAEVDFTGTGAYRAIRADVLLTEEQRNLPRLLYLTRQLSPLDVLLRWFILGVPVEEAIANSRIPPEILEILFKCGLLLRHNGSLASPVSLAPFERFWVCTDTRAKIRSGENADDVLLINTTSIISMHLTIRQAARSVLDLGSGCGILALKAAEHAGCVVAADINERAVQFARFNVWLNQCTNVECLTSDLFSALQGRQFDLIVANPPFYITPFSHRIFAENPMELDGFCRRLVKEAALFLNEGGHLQMLCEWAEIQEQSWQERLLEWFQGIGCDALVFQGGVFDPLDYATSRIPVVAARAVSDERVLNDWMDYYARSRVVAIHSGFITMRKRTGENWVHFEKMSEVPNRSTGEEILRRFRSRDLLLASPEEQMLGWRIRIADGVRLSSSADFRGREWTRSEVPRLLQTKGLRLADDLSPAVADFVLQFDGERTLGEMLQKLAAETSAPPELVRQECLDLVCRLLDRGFMTGDFAAQR